MQVQDFCSQMEKQLDAYRESLGKIEEKLDAGGTKAKQPILDLVGDIKNLMTELNLQKERLERECPSEWSDEKSQMDDLVGQIKDRMNRASSELSLGYVGG